MCIDGCKIPIKAQKKQSWSSMSSVWINAWKKGLNSRQVSCIDVHSFNYQYKVGELSVLIKIFVDNWYVA